LVKQAIGDFLLRRLEEAGIRHIFGVAGDYNLELMQQLEDRQSPACEIDRLTRICWRRKLPVYMELPSDIGYLTIEVPQSPFVLAYEPSDEERLSTCVSKIRERLDRAVAPALLLDMDAERFGVGERIGRLARQVNIPVATLPGAKGVFPEDSTLLVGVYSGAGSAKQLRKVIERSDCLITCGYRRVDSTSGFFTDKIRTDSIALNGQYADVDGENYQAVYLVELIDRLIEDTASLVPKNSSVSRPPQTYRVRCGKIANLVNGHFGHRFRISFALATSSSPPKMAHQTRASVASRWPTD
jgi:TPP-dependent 2-oxoacid decarboxylase